jgi:hypothetical protein
VKPLFFQFSDLVRYESVSKRGKQNQGPEFFSWEFENRTVVKAQNKKKSVRSGIMSLFFLQANDLEVKVTKTSKLHLAGKRCMLTPVSDFKILYFPSSTKFRFWPFRARPQFRLGRISSVWDSMGLQNLTFPCGCFCTQKQRA